MPDPLRPSSGNGIGRKRSTPSLQVPSLRTAGDRAIRRVRSHSNLANVAAAAAFAEQDEVPFEQAFAAMYHQAVAAQDPAVSPAPTTIVTTPPIHQAAPILQPQPTPLSVSAIVQGKVKVWMSALTLMDRARKLEAEQVDVAAATAGLQAMALSDGFSPAGSGPVGFAPVGFAPVGFAPVGFAPVGFAPLQPCPRLLMGCDECYDGGVMPCAECEEAMNLAATGCQCEPGGITSCDHPNCRAAEYDQEDDDEETVDGAAFDDEHEDGDEVEYEV